jgi:hypothetical protein
MQEENKMKTHSQQVAKLLYNSKLPQLSFSLKDKLIDNKFLG